jgi:hypothetical protein
LVINFSAHMMRAGQAGAREDFEQMIGLLVGAIYGEASLVFANPGDWGIDVLLGDLRGEAAIWQAKYFMPGVTADHRAQIKDSFASAMKAAAANGYVIARWILCIPSSMDGSTTKWWQGWKAEREQETGVTIELWDENRLRGLLLQPTAADVRRDYYDLRARDERVDEPPGKPGRLYPPPARTATAPTGWHGGAEYTLGNTTYLLHDELVERLSSDHSWVWREATADQIEPAGGRVRLRQAEVLRAVSSAAERRAALIAQAGLLSQLRGRAGIPGLIASFDEPNLVTVVTAHPPGFAWTRVFGPFAISPDRMTAACALAAAAELCSALAELHLRGASHRELHPGALFVDRGERCYVRDVGLACLPMSAGEGEALYRAPEQMRAVRADGASTDVYQIAAIMYHTLTAHPPAARGCPPVRATVPDFPEALDNTLMRALGSDPAGRPDVRELAQALRSGRRELARAGRP